MSGLNWALRVEASSTDTGTEVDAAAAAIDRALERLEPHIHLEALHDLRRHLDHEIAVRTRAVYGDPDGDPEEPE